MIVFHGSILEVPKPDIVFSKRNLDFGQGFYVTSYREQAEVWAFRKAMRQRGNAVVSVYEYTESSSELNVLKFDASNEAWLEFVCSCRRGEELWKNYDLIIGHVADDKVFKAVDMYCKGLWNKAKTLEELVYYKNNDQLAFISQRSIDLCLKFQNSYEVKHA